MPGERFLVVPIYDREEYLAAVEKSPGFQHADENRIVFVSADEQTDDLAIDSLENRLLAEKLLYWADSGSGKKKRGSVVDFYLSLKDFLKQKGCFEDFERSFMNAALFDELAALKNAETDSSYRDILTDIKYYVEDKFHFLDKPVTYYYDLDWIKDYVARICKKPDNSAVINNPKVTVVIPSLNSRQYIRECIESVIEQSLKEIEILCVDAGSTDGTTEVLQEYAKLDSRIRIIHSDKKSYGYQINLGIKAAKGEYFAILESDDYIVPEMYEELYQIAKNNRVEVLKADYEVFTGEKDRHDFIYIKIVKEDAQYNKVLDPTDKFEFFKNKNIPWSGLYDIKFLKQNDILLNESPGASYQDNGLWFQCLCQTHRLYYVNKSYYRLRRDNPDSSIYNRNKVFCICDEYDFIRNVLRKDKDLEKRFASWSAYPRFTNYKWRLNAIAEELKIEFLQRFANDFKIIENNDELDPALFTKPLWNQLHRIMDNPKEFYYNESLLTYEFYRVLPPERYPQILKRWFKKMTGKTLDLDNPKSFNEKIQWLKLYDNIPSKARLSDKYLVREWVRDKIGETYLFSLLGVWDRFDEIDFAKLPQSFVLKATHGIGWHTVVQNKAELDIDEVKNKFDTWLKTNYAAKGGLELQYADIRPRIIAEPYLEKENSVSFGCKVFCFNGRSNSIMCLIKNKENVKMAFYDIKWKRLPFTYMFPAYEADLEKPVNLELLISLAEKMAQGFSFVSVDFNVLNDGQLKFKKMDFTAMAGTGKWGSSEQDLTFGKLIDLPTGKKTPLPKMSLAEKGAVPMPDNFVLPKSETEILKSSIKVKDARINSLTKENVKLKKQITDIKNSKSFILGERIVWPIRKIRKLIKK